MTHTCKICGKKIKDSKSFSTGRGLFVHVKRVHGLSKEGYIRKYDHVSFSPKKCGWCNKDAVPSAVFKSGKFYLIYEKFLCASPDCKKVRKKYNILSYEYVQKTYNLSMEEARLRVSSSNPFHKEYHKSEEEYRAFQNNSSLKSFIKRYGKDGKDKFEEYCKKISKANSRRGFQEKHGEEKWRKLCKSKAITLQNLEKKYGRNDAAKRIETWKRKVVNTADNFIARHGCDKGVRLYEQYIDKQKRHLLEVWTDVFGSQEAIKKWNEYRSKISQTLENLQNKYGPEEGLKRYIEANEKRQNFKKSSFVSKISLDFFNKLQKKVSFKIIYGHPEPWIKNGIKKAIKVDGLVEQVDSVIEFYGDYYHCNPLIYSFNYYSPVKKMTAQEVWDKDKIRQNTSLSIKPFLFIVWEKSFRQNKDETIDLLVSFLQRAFDGRLCHGLYEI